jgi:hypothetical protein
MPQRPQRPCRHKGCRSLHRNGNGHCDEHAAEAKPFASARKVERITGRALQARRLRMWTASPYCAHCGRLTAWPRGFELDHKVRLTDGGGDEDSDTQVLCIAWVNGVKTGCHVEKSQRENAGLG